MDVQSLVLTKSTRVSIETHASATYPEECCGIIIERAGTQEVVRVSNVQNEMHAKDPAHYPRTATTAYSMGPEAAPVLMAAQRGEVRLLAIYHSHPEHDAYFSAEDKVQALGGWDEPMYPEVTWVVLSVRQGQVVACRGFVWNVAAADFIDGAIVVR